MHKEHRKRMKDRFLTFGPDVFFDHELLEMILFFSIPRINTNPQAHALLKRFGTLRGVFEASARELTSVEGIGINSAVLIKLIGAIKKRDLDNENYNRVKLNKFSVTREYVTELFAGFQEERLYIILLDNTSKLIDVKCMASGTVSYSSINSQEMLRFAILKNASSVLLAHNHPNGIAIPSSKDISATLALKSAFDTVGIRFIDHFVVSGDRCNGIIKGDQAFELISRSTK